MTVTKRLFLLPLAFLYCGVRALGRTMKIHKMAWALGLAAIALWAYNTGGIDNGAIFELDGNTVPNNGVPPLGGHDWDQVYADHLSGTIPPATSGALAIGFDTDAVNTTQDNIFQGGGSKDTQGLQSGPWLWTKSKPQGKDDITHAYAAAYTLPNGHLGLYVGADRFDNSGDATIGFWFFQDPNVGLTNTAQGGGFRFSGVHTNNDLLLISDFTVGGSTSTIAVYKWVGDDATGSLVFVPTPVAGETFATVNGANTTPAWSFTNKSHQAFFAPGEFFEGGVDLTAIFQGTTPCLSVFMAETRSSQSPTATLSDFTLPSPFPLCGIKATKTCTGAQIQSDGVTVKYNFSGTCSNDGIGTVTGLTVTDVPNNGSGFSGLTITGPSPTTLAPKGQPGDTANFTGSFTTNFLSSTIPNIATCSGTAGGVTVSADGSWLPPGGGLPEVCTPVGSGCLNLVKSCATVVTGGNPLAIEVDVSGTISNGANVKVSNITILDDHAATITITCVAGCTGTTNGAFALDPGGSATYTGSYTESGSNITCTPNPAGGGRCAFADTATASGDGSLGAGIISQCAPAGATCYLCPDGSCRTP